VASPYLSIEQCVDIARVGAAAGCKEALFTLGDQPELRYSAARWALDAMSHASTLDYVAAAARAVYEQTGLLPHLNPGGVMSANAIAKLRTTSVSMGLMFETTAERLSERGGPTGDPRTRCRQTGSTRCARPAISKYRSQLDC
jgi:FO synthase